MFSTDDLQRLAQHGIAKEEAERQIALLREPPPATSLDRPSTVGDGISRIRDIDHRSLIDRAEAAASAGRVMKFVPASGAATRMFKDLIAALHDQRRPSALPAGREFFEHLDAFAFAEELCRRAEVAPEDEASERRVLATLLEEMGYAQKPKGLIPFHRVEKARTAFEEQLLEGTRYARTMHFTVAPEFRREFEETLVALAPDVMRRRRGIELNVSFSEQHPSTDTLAIDADGNPFRAASGELLFRPGGHGALLRNLQLANGDIVVIKNIDNIVPDEANGEVVRWKQILIGYLIRIQQEVFELLEACSREDVPEAWLDRALALAAFRFARRPASLLATPDEKRRFVFDALDRPLRVCGVVINEGEPGGAPFWVVGRDGVRSVQIVESAQVATSCPEQVAIFKSSTHFNPVDIICGLRSWRGEPFDLERFVDPESIFIAKKSFEGRELNALERPGLWNGAMAGWNTICVEVPASTFAPVKTVFDLLRPQHQVQAPTEVEARKLSEDLQAAVDVQRTLQLHDEISAVGFDAASMFQRSLDVSGDIFNVCGRVAFLADVSGHGAASVLMASVVSQRLMSMSDASPAQVMKQLEREFPFERFGKYLTLVFVVVDDDALRYACAGHPGPIVIREDGSIERLTSSAPVIGIGCNAEFSEGKVAINPGDRVVLYSDGLLDDENLKGEHFGLEALEEHFAAARSQTLADACASLGEVLHERRGDAPPRDDIALLALEIV